jgi:hypothetical protein
LCKNGAKKNRSNDLLQQKAEIYANILQRIKGNEEWLNRVVTGDENIEDFSMKLS